MQAEVISPRRVRFFQKDIPGITQRSKEKRQMNERVTERDRSFPNLAIPFGELSKQIDAITIAVEINRRRIKRVPPVIKSVNKAPEANRFALSGM